MNPQSLFVVDDKEQRRETIVARLQEAFPEASISTAFGPIDADRAVSARHMDIVLVDLHLTEDDDSLPEDRWEYAGIDVINQVAKNSPSTAIVAYSGSFGRGKALDSPIGRSAKQAGADLVVSRTEIDSAAPKELKELLLDLFERKRSENIGGTQIVFPNDYAMRMACDIVGEHNIANLITHSMPDLLVESVNCLVGGLSGAVVLGVIANHATTESSTANCVIKIDKAHKIDHEFDSQPEIGTLLGEHTTRIAPFVTKEVNGWKALRMAFVTQREMLRTVLESGQIDPSHNEMFEQIVDWALNAIRIESASTLYRRWDVAQLRFSASDLFRIESTLTGLLNAHEVLDTFGNVAVKEMKRSLHLVEKIDFGSAALMSVQQHGDLNCRNIFISTDAPPRFIDLPDHSLYPRFFDIAQLMVDAFSMSFERLGGHRHRLDRQDRIWVLFQSIFFGKDYENSNTQDPTITLLYRLANAVSTETSLEGEEWQRLVAYHCLQFLRYTDLPLSRKRVLAIAARVILAPAFED